MSTVEKQRVIEALDGLDADQLQQIADFIAFLQFKGQFTDEPLSFSRFAQVYAAFADQYYADEQQPPQSPA